jgi:hypothetical protein
MIGYSETRVKRVCRIVSGSISFASPGGDKSQRAEGGSRVSEPCSFLPMNGRLRAWKVGPGERRQRAFNDRLREAFFERLAGKPSAIKERPQDIRRP